MNNIVVAFMSILHNILDSVCLLHVIQQYYDEIITLIGFEKKDNIEQKSLGYKTKAHILL